MIARTIDYAILKPDMTREEAEAAAREAVRLNMFSVCVQPRDIEMAKKVCGGTDTKVGVVLDFPQGAATPEAKGLLARCYSDMGVDEIDMVMDYGAALSGDWDTVKDGVCRVVAEAKKKGVDVKVIFETCFLTPEQIARGVEVCVEAGADFVKTSTGFAAKGATPEAVRAMVDAAKGRIRVKASGGMRDYASAKAYLDMGAERLGIGCSSAKNVCDGE